MPVNSRSTADAEAIRQQTERVLSSQVFFLAKRSQAFLRYVVEKSLLGLAPKEYEIAIDVFARSADYDPTVEATVRVEASRLRNRLRQYYDTEGKHDPILIEVPKGGYAAVFTHIELESRPETAGPPPVWSSKPPLNSAASATHNGQSPGTQPIESDTAKREYPESVRTRCSSAWVWIALVAAFSAAIVFAAWRVVRGRYLSASQEPIRSLAVMPFRNLSGDPNQEYFADGITDEVTTDLGRIPALHVVSSASLVNDARERDKPFPQIARDLNVDAFVAGAVARFGDRVRVDARLIDARSGREVWAQTFEEQISNVLTLQDEVAGKIAAQTQTALLPARSNRLPCVNPSAYDAYLRAGYFFQKQNWRLSASYFRKAIAIDPSYASAYAGLAAALDAQTTFQEARPDSDMRQALAASKRAIRLDPNNGAAYTELGSIQTIYSWNWTAAERNLIRGITLSPNSALAEMKYAAYLDAVGQPEKAVDHMRRALALNPLSFFMSRRLGATLYFDRRYQEALDELRTAAEMEPEQSASFDNYMSAALEMRGLRTQAVQDDLAALHSSWPALNIALLDGIYRHGGWQSYWRARIDALRPYAGKECVCYGMALAEIRLGHVDHAFSLLNQTVDQRCYAVIYFKTEPLLDPIRNDPRYALLLRRINLSR